MEVRSYYATTVEAAMATAKKELGSEAMLVQWRPSPPELLHLGRYEVVFAGELQRIPERAAPKKVSKLPVSPAIVVTPAVPDAPPPAGILSLRDLQVGRNRLSEIPEAGPMDLVGRRDPRQDPEAADFLSRLSRQRAEEKTVVIAPPHTPAPSPLKSPLKLPLKSQLHEVPDPIGDLTRKLRCSPGLGRAHSLTQMVALLGPSGAGKTSTIMKLAVVKGLQEDRAVRLLALDSERVGATASLRHFADLLKIPFTECETEGELSETLDTYFDGLTLVDTAGYGQHDGVALRRLERCFAAHPEMQCHVILRADRTNAANLAALNRFSIFAPERLILTALDEAPALEGLRALIAQSGLPVSFLGMGQRVPEDIEAASPRRLAELILNGWSAAERAAA